MRSLLVSVLLLGLTKNLMAHKMADASRLATAGDQARPDDMFDVLEYMDADEFVLVALRAPRFRWEWRSLDEQWLCPSRTVDSFWNGSINKAEISTGRHHPPPPLTAYRGALDHMIPGYHRAARLNAS